MLIYVIVGITAVAGLLDAPWWAAVAGACLLVLALSNGHVRSQSQNHALMLVGDATRMSATLANGTLGATLAFAAGRGSALLWGI